MADAVAKPLEGLLEAALEHTVQQQLLDVTGTPSSAAQGGSCAAAEDGPGPDAASRSLCDTSKDGKQVAWERRFVQMVLSLSRVRC